MLGNVGLDLKLTLVVEADRVRKRYAEPGVEVLLELLVLVILPKVLSLGSVAFEAWKLQYEIGFWLL